MPLDDETQLAWLKAFSEKLDKTNELLEKLNQQMECLLIEIQQAKQE